MRTAAIIVLVGGLGALASVAPAPRQDATYDVLIEALDPVVRPGKPARFRITFANFQEKAVDVPVPDDVLDGLAIVKPDGTPLRKSKDAVPSSSKRTLQKGEYFGKVFELNDFGSVGEDEQGLYQFVWRSGAATSLVLVLPVIRDYIATVQTNMGEIKFELYPEIAPRTVIHFVALCRQGAYKESDFHRIVRDFVMQGGRAKGRVDKVQAELSLKAHHEEGSVAMALPAGDANGATSEFYICFRKRPELDHRYTVFGRVVDGKEVVKRIERVKTDHDTCRSCGGNPCNAKDLHCGQGHEDKPVDAVIIKDITVDVRK